MEILDPKIDSTEFSNILQKTTASLQTTHKSIIHDSLSKAEIAAIMYCFDKVAYRLQSILSKNTLKEIKIHTAAVTQDTFVNFEKMCSSPSLNALFTNNKFYNYVLNLSPCMFYRAFENKSPSQCNPSSCEFSGAQFRNFKENFLNNFYGCFYDVTDSKFETSDMSSSLNTLNYINDIYSCGICCTFEMTVYDNESSDPNDMLNHGLINLYFSRSTYERHLSKVIKKFYISENNSHNEDSSIAVLGSLNIPSNRDPRIGEIYPLSSFVSDDVDIRLKKYPDNTYAKGKIILITEDDSPVERYGIQITEVTSN